MRVSEREYHIKVLENLLSHYKAREKCEGYYDSTLKDNVEALQYAISSLKTDLKYDLMYEGEEIYTKADMIAMLSELKYDLYPELCKEIHGKEDCPCVGQTTSCLATFRVCDADRAVGRTIQQKINALKENKDAI